jgi:hypothetical protein
LARITLWYASIRVSSRKRSASTFSFTALYDSPSDSY